MQFKKMSSEFYDNMTQYVRDADWSRRRGIVMAYSRKVTTGLEETWDIPLTGVKGKFLILIYI